MNVEIDDSGTRINVFSDWRWKELVKSIPGSSWSSAENVWRVPLSWASCLALRSTFRDELLIGPKLSAWATAELTERVQPCTDMRDQIDAPGASDLYPYQRAGVRFLTAARRALLADDPGAGKTAQAIRALAELYASGELEFPVLVVCPNTMKKTWSRELQKWWPGVTSVIVKGGAAARRKQFAQPAHFYIVNWESLRAHSRLAPYGSIALARCFDCGGESGKISENRCEVHERELNKFTFGAVIADECFVGGTKISTPSGEKSIEDVQVGDVVYGYDHSAECVVESRVTDTFSRKSTEIVNGWGATPNHPVYVHGEGYRPLGDLTGDEILLQADLLPLRKSCRPVSEKEVEVLLRRVQHSEPGENVRLVTRTKSRVRDARLRDLWEARRVSAQHRQSTEPDDVQPRVQEGVSSSRELHQHSMRVVQGVVHSTQVEDSSAALLFQKVRSTMGGKSARDTSACFGEHVTQPARPIFKAESCDCDTRELRREPVQWLQHAEGASLRAVEAQLAQGSLNDEHQSQTHVSGSADVEWSSPATSTRTSSELRAVGEQTDVRVLGHRVSRDEVSGGGGRRSPSSPGPQGCRCDPNRAPHDPRVDGHPLLELRSLERYRRVCRESTLGAGEAVEVYSLTTETGNYFAHGVLVRNCHRAKNAQAKQTRALWAATGDAPIRIALTGTPLANNVLDLWSIMHWVAPEEWPTKTKFVDRMVDTMLNAFGGLMVLGVKPQMADEFYKVLNPRMRRMTKEVVLPWLPPIVFERRDVEMSPKQAKAYKQMRDELISELEGDLLAAPSPLTQSLRLAQFASSYAVLETQPDGTSKVRLQMPSSKITAFLDDLDDFGDDAVAVMAVSRQLIELLSAELEKRKIPHGLVTGAQTEDQRQVAIDDFQSGRTKLLLFTAAAGGVGVTLTAARYLVRLQRPWSRVDDVQALNRVHRIGSEIHDTIVVIDYVSDGTIDERVIKVLDEKGESFESVVRDRDLWLKWLRNDDEDGE